MTDPPRSPETEGDARPDTDGGAARGRPRWVLVLVVAAAVALLGLMIFLHLSGTLGPGVH